MDQITRLAADRQHQLLADALGQRPAERLAALAAASRRAERAERRMRRAARRHQPANA